jgi:hypothetical protein
MIEYLAPGFLYSLAKDAWALLRGRRRLLKPQEVLALRQKWKKEFEPMLWERHQKGLGLDVIVRDVKRLDGYPETTDANRKGISAWFKVGLMATYHKGIEVGLQWYGLTNDPKHGWRHANYKAGEKADVTAVMIGNIPYENIEQVDWRGDDFYSNPQIYCHFDAAKGQPYERLTYCTEHQNPGGPRFYRKVATVDEVEANTKNAGFKYP